MRSKLVWAIVPGADRPARRSRWRRAAAATTRAPAETASKFAPPTAAPDNAKKGGTLEVIAAGDVDYIDPGAAYYQFTYMVTSATQRALLSWQPDDDEPSRRPTSPRSEPTISSDNKTITFKIRPGIRYSPPLGGGQGVNRDVTSADVKYAVERGAPARGVQRATRPSTSAPSRASSRPRRRSTKDPTTAPEISGIETPDDQTIVFKLDQTRRRSGGHASAVAADQRAGAGGVREAVRRREPLDLRRAPARHRAPTT